MGDLPVVGGSVWFLTAGVVVGRCVMTTRPVTTWDVLNGHVTLDLQCLDRIYLNGYVPNLQVGGQIVQFLAG